MLKPPPHKTPSRKRAVRGEQKAVVLPFPDGEGGLPAPHIGIDEAGRGCLAGPVVAAAVLFPTPFDAAEHLPGLNDSKKLGEAQRDRLAGLISDRASAYGIGLAWQEEIDGVNIRNATFRAMARALLSLAAMLEQAGNATASALSERETRKSKALPLVLIDGNAVIPESQWAACALETPQTVPAWKALLPPEALRLPSFVPALPEQRAVIGGDALVPAISAASILAKTARDALMTRLDGLFSGYGFARHKGYGTREHLAALAALGPCALHRKSFRRVRPEQEQGTLF